ncbi:MAG TPA: amino acid ABC transporter permease [Rhodocyclaceae bacterium]|nr:amino acid ABC transporter permease [Rhodocyclaceae bacterium]HMV54796.1 amino acid ABC transporter permease [Rhodocyclaceae bacterium]HMZ83777.1 amino acid ABC transporter permease [Rhodocyclaceae bacterium]HNA04341.1 amino acid ABC transporter permease [Rhodocyclaceae bacterium]HNB78804.1 amino acid ABC transporter permease [Rhodocyclaceae bacterium]
MNYHWDWHFFTRQVQAGDETYVDWLLTGLGWTLACSLTAWIIALSIGTLVGTLRTTGSRGLAGFGATWVELFRNIPLLVQMLLWFFVVPELLPRDLALWVKQDMPAKEFVTATLCLGLFTSARIAEQVRAGIESLPRGQREAALALGLSPFQAYRHVLLPRALRTVLAPLTSEFMNTFKNSSVAYAIGLMELTFQARQMQEDSEQGIETYLAVTLLYFLCAFIANRGMAWIERRTRVPGMIG